MTSAPGASAAERQDPDPIRGNSYVSIAYSRIRALILSGDLASGARVTVRPLADLLQLSPTPIRAALVALERQGLLEVRAHRGYFVPTLGREDMLEVYEIREAVDSIASRRLAHSSSRETTVSVLDDLVAQQRRCVQNGDLDAYGELDVVFHRTIWHGSGNRRLVSVADNLLGQVRIGNNISARAPGRLPRALDEHSRIVEALRRGDAQAAEDTTRDHVRQAGMAFSELLS